MLLIYQYQETLNPNRKLNGVELIDMEIKQHTDETLAMRRKNIPKARTIINLHKNEFYDSVLKDLSPCYSGFARKTTTL